MKVLFDTNVILDVMRSRAPGAEPSAQLMAMVEQEKLVGLLCTTTITTIHYLVHRSLGSRAAQKHVRTLLSIFAVTPVTWETLSDAINLNFADFEDGILHEAARHADAVGIVTGDPRSFSKSHLPVYSPLELLNTLKQPQFSGVAWAK